MLPKKKWKRPPVSSSDSTNSSSTRFDSEEPVYNLSLNLLARRSYSVHELRLKLSAKTSNGAAIETVIEKLLSRGYLDDRRYIETFLHSREKRTEGYSRITNELRRRGLAPDLIREVLDQIYPEDQDHLALIRALEKKAQTISTPMDEKKIAKLYNHLVRKGFRDEDVRREIRIRFGPREDF